MTAQDEAYPIVDFWIDKFVGWLKHRRDLSELRQMNRADFNLIAQDLRISPDDLERLVRAGEHGADEMPKMLKALGIDVADLARVEQDYTRYLGYVVRGSGHTRVGKLSYANVDVARTWALIEAFIDTKQVVYVFVDYRIQEQLYEHARAHGVSQRELDGLFQYPHGRGRAHGIIRHWPNHRHHFHVRFRS